MQISNFMSCWSTTPAEVTDAGIYRSSSVLSWGTHACDPGGGPCSPRSGLSMAVGSALGPLQLSPLQVGPGCFWLSHPSVFIRGGFCSLFLCRLQDHLPIILWLPTLLLSENSTNPHIDLNQTWIKIWVPSITPGPQQWPSKVSFPQCFSSCLHLSLWLGSQGLSLLAPIH